MVEQEATTRLLLLYTARPEFHAQWPPRAHHTQITLNRLSLRNARMMVREVAAQKALSEETIATVLERCETYQPAMEQALRQMRASRDTKAEQDKSPDSYALGVFSRDRSTARGLRSLGLLVS
jgi:hypothetical protein